MTPREQADDAPTLAASAAAPGAPTRTRAIRAAPAADAPIIGAIREGDEPTVLDTAAAGAWIKVAYDSLVGYVEPLDS